MAGLSVEGTIELSVEVDGRSFRAVLCDVEESLGSCGKISVEVRTTADVDFDPLIETDATVLITIDGVEARRFTRRLGGATFIGLDEASLRYALELYPAFWFLQFGKNTRKFRDVPAETIVSKILDEGGVPHEWRNQRKTESRPYTVQYRETNFAFVSRLLEFEGIYYYFEPDGTMILGDTSSAESDVPGLPVFELRESEGAMSHGAVGVTSFVRGCSVLSGKATVNDHDWKKPSLSLLGSTDGPRDTDLEIYDYPAGYRDPGVGKMISKLRLEALAAEKSWAEGTSTVPWFSPGRHFMFMHAEALDFSGKVLLVRVAHAFKSATGQDSDRGSYENRFFAIPSDVPWRPPLATPRSLVQGNHSAMVRGPAGEEIHTDTHGRAKVQFHWDREAKGTDEDSRWIRVLQETTSSMVLARVGWEISVGYIDGDPDRPVGTGRLIDGKMMPTYGQPARMNMMSIKTESYPGKKGFNELRMDDSSGAMRMDVHAQRDLLNTVENDKTEKITSDHTHYVKVGVDRAIEKNQKVTIGGDEIKDVQEQYNESVKKNRSEKISGSESLQFATNASRNVQGNDKEDVGGLRFTFAGIPQISIPSPEETIKMLVPHSMGAATDGGGGANVFAESLVQLGSGASAKEVAAGAANNAAGAAANALMSGGDVGAAVSESLGLPSEPGGVADAVKSAIPSADSLLQAGKQAAIDSVLRGTITRDVRKRLTRTVGGAWIMLAGGSIMNSTGKLFVEAIGGLKLTTSLEGSIMQSVGKYLIDTVGGFVFRKSKDDMSVASQTSYVRVGGVATMHSDELIELRGKEIEIEGQTKVTLKSGDLLIEMTPECTTIKGTLKAKSGSGIKIAGNPDELTA